MATCDESAKNGDLGGVISACVAGEKPSAKTFALAAESGNIELLEWLSANECPCDYRVYIKAILTKNSAVFKWAVNKKIPLTDALISYIITKNGVDLINWLRDQPQYASVVNKALEENNKIDFRDSGAVGNTATNMNTFGTSVDEAVAAAPNMSLDDMQNYFSGSVNPSSILGFGQVPTATPFGGFGNAYESEEESEDKKPKVKLYLNFSPRNAFLVGPFKDTLAAFRETYLTPSTDFHYCSKLSLGKGWFIPNQLVDSFITLLEDQTEDFDLEILECPQDKKARRKSYKEMYETAVEVLGDELAGTSEEKVAMIEQFILKHYSSTRTGGTFIDTSKLWQLVDPNTPQPAPDAGTYSEMIDASIKYLHFYTKKPVSRDLLKRHILANYPVNEKLSNHHINKNLRQAVLDGKLVKIGDSFQFK